MIPIKKKDSKFSDPEPLSEHILHVMDQERNHKLTATQPLKAHHAKEENSINANSKEKSRSSFKTKPADQNPVDRPSNDSSHKYKEGKPEPFRMKRRNHFKRRNKKSQHPNLTRKKGNAIGFLLGFEKRNLAAIAQNGVENQPRDPQHQVPLISNPVVPERIDVEEPNFHQLPTMEAFSQALASLISNLTAPDQIEVEDDSQVPHQQRTPVSNPLVSEQIQEENAV